MSAVTMNRQLSNLLADTIVRFCRKHNYFSEELKVQGTICITSDASAFLVTQISNCFQQTLSGDEALSPRPTHSSPNFRSGHLSNVKTIDDFAKPQNLVIREINQNQRSEGSSLACLRDSETTREDALINDQVTCGTDDDNNNYINNCDFMHEVKLASYEGPQKVKQETDIYQLDMRAARNQLLEHPVEGGQSAKKRKWSQKMQNYEDYSKSDCAEVKFDSNLVPTSAIKSEIISDMDDGDADMEDSPSQHDLEETTRPEQTANELSFTFTDEMAIGSYSANVSEDPSAGLEFLTPQYASFQGSIKGRGRNLTSNIASTYVQRTSSGKYGCTLCNMVYSNRGTLQRHIEARHLGRNYTCVICHMTFESHSGWSRHLRTKHSQHMPLECGVCGEKFKLTMALEQHMRRKHGTAEIAAAITESATKVQGSAS